ncbi:MAG: MafI family immunity protein [Candidatus Dormibacteraceae bacterium]
MEAEFEELIRSSRGLLSSNEISELREFIEARQYALALEALCGILVDENKHVTPELYSRIHGLVEVLDGVDPNALESVRAVVRY